MTSEIVARTALGVLLTTMLLLGAIVYALLLINGMVRLP